MFQYSSSGEGQLSNKTRSFCCTNAWYFPSHFHQVYLEEWSFEYMKKEWKLMIFIGSTIDTFNPFSHSLPQSVPPKGGGANFAPPPRKKYGGIFQMCYQKIILKMYDFRHTKKNWGKNLKKWPRFWDFKIFAAQFVIVIKCPSFGQMSIFLGLVFSKLHYFYVSIHFCKKNWGS